MAALAPSQDALHQLKALEAAIQCLEGQLEPFVSLSPRDLDTQLEPLQRALVQLALAQSAEAVFRLYLRASGVAEEGHTVTKAAERIRLYEKKVSKLESEKWLKEHSAKTQLNVAAANRFISAAIPDLTPTQRLALKVATAQVSEQARQRPPASGAAGKSKRKASAAEEAEAFLAAELGSSAAAAAPVAWEPGSNAAPGSGAAAGSAGGATNWKKITRQQ